MKYIFVVLIIFMSFHADAKRKRRQRETERENKPGVTVLNKDGFEYSVKMTSVPCEKTAEKLCSMKAAIISKVKATDELKWETPIYVKELNPNVAVEAQEVKVYSLRWKGSSIEVRDARDTPYILESETGVMTKPARPIYYPAGTSAPEPTPRATPTPKASPAESAATPESPN
jgi:hypothetical protein